MHPNVNIDSSIHSFELPLKLQNHVKKVSKTKDMYALVGQ
jgi:hypothetical protein